MDAGLSTAGIGGCCTRIEVRGCLIFGGAVIDHPSYYDFTCNTVVGGGLVAGAEETAAIRGNYIVGPAAAGIWLRPSDADIFEIEDNVVSGTSEGIVVDGSNHLYGDFHHNTVTDCAGSGFRVFAPGPTNAPKIRHNVVRRCGGHGFDFSNVIAMPDSNDVEDVALDGIRVSGPYAAARIVGNHIVRAGSAGIRLDAQTQAWSPLSGNVVLASGSDGMVSPGGATLDHNVVGRCAGAGVRMTAGSQAQALRYNTVYLNHGTGFDVTGTGAPVTVDHNIAFENDGAGFRWSGSGSPDLACNDWFGNGGGATVGVPPGATDLALLPMFCDVDADSVALASDSPLADAPGCDLIGALPVGCGALSAVAPSSGARESAFAAWPQPGRGTIHLSWRDLGGPGLLEIFDLAGRRCLRTGIAPGATGLDWSGADPGGRRLPAGVYLARLVGAGRALHLRIVIAG
jgi:hypothetical protein